MVNYTPAPSAVAVRPGNFLESFNQGLQTGENIREVFTSAKARRRRNKVLRILGQPDKLTQENLQEIRKVDPILAFEVMQAKAVMDDAKRQNDIEGRKAALQEYRQTIDIGADVASNLKQLPPEQRDGALVQMLTPLAENEYLKPMVMRIARHYQDGNMDDAKLDSIMARAVGHRTVWEAEMAKTARDEKAEAKAAEERLQQHGSLYLEAARQAGRVEIENIRTQRAIDVERIKNRRKIPTDRKVADLMRKVGPDMSHAAALHIIDPGKTEWSIDPETGAAVAVDETGKTLNLKPYKDWLEGVKPEDQATLPTNPKGSPAALIGQLRGSQAPAPTPIATRQRRQAPVVVPNTQF